MKRYKSLLILLFVSFLGLQAANDIRFVIDVPPTVVKGERFYLSYILDGAEGSNINVPEQIEGFKVLYGPVPQVASSMVNNNGRITSSYTVTYVYTVEAVEEGTYTMPSASIVANGRNYKSNTAKVKVLPPDKNATQQKGQPVERMTSTSTADKISEDDVFIRAIFSKTKVNEQEAVVVTFRFYSTLPIVRYIESNFPEFEGFIMEEFDSRINRYVDVENYKGRNYNVYDVKKTLLFPQRSGKITIPSGSVTMVLVVPTGQMVRDFFGSKMINAEVQKTFRSSPVVVDVEKLPEGKPLNFSGGVGVLSMKSSITSTKIKANEAITLKVDISGTGNLKLIKTPEVKAPKEFEAYDPKVTNDFKTTTDGQAGTKSIEYLFIPRQPGKYTIPETTISYFDTSTRQYKTLKAPAYEIDVDKDPNAGTAQSATSYINQKEVEVEQDIRYLKTRDIEFRSHSDFFIGSMANFLWYVVPMLLLAISVVMYRKQIQANADIARMKTKKANKVASRRLKLVNKYLKNHDKDKFYEESLRAMWGYLSDKLTIPIANLNRENVETELRTYGVGDELIGRFIAVIDSCEFARYAPSSSGSAMDTLYTDMVSAIGEMESVIKIK